MDQHEEQQQQEGRSKESTDQRKEEEEDRSAESMDRRKEGKSSEELMEQRKAAEAGEEEERSSDEEEEAMAAWSVFGHPCSLLQYMVRVCACCLGLQDSFGGTKPSVAPQASAADSSQEGEEDKKTSTTGFYMQEVITRTRVWTLAMRRPRPPGNPREGSGGNGGHHH